MAIRAWLCLVVHGYQRIYAWLLEVIHGYTCMWLYMVIAGYCSADYPWLFVSVVVLFCELGHPE